MELCFVDTNSAVAAALRREFREFPEIKIVDGDILAIAHDTVVAPSNSQGFMDGGIDRVYCAFFGPEIETRVRDSIGARPMAIFPWAPALWSRQATRAFRI